ncbi:unnamed protein product [Clavelina lepadiformis]|uniref:Uncharacterized protein n=1 Tax=Clavelina lepadiformis TaxID=159417 RepID=A0ABP0GVD1_CLALP
MRRSQDESFFSTQKPKVFLSELLVPEKPSKKSMKQSRTITNVHSKTKPKVAKKTDNTTHNSKCGQEQINERPGTFRHPSRGRNVSPVPDYSGSDYKEPDGELNELISHYSLVTECAILVAMTRKTTRSAFPETTQVVRNAVPPKSVRKKG